MRTSEEDLERELGRATRLDQFDCPVEVDVGARGELEGGVDVVAALLERLGTPALDPLGLGLGDVQLVAAIDSISSVLFIGTFG